MNKSLPDNSTKSKKKKDINLVLPRNSEMSELIQSFDWSKTPLGSRDTWSPILRTTVDIMLSNRFPMLLWWGEDYISIYNDAYIPILGAKHPWGLGKPVRTCWSEIWHILQPLIDKPFKGGEATWMEDITLELKRHGFLEETHFTIAYSPTPDETAPNRIGGVLATVVEITDKVIGERRINILRELGFHATDAKTKQEACVLSAKTLANHPYDVPFAMFYLIDENGTQANLVGSAGINTGKSISPLVIDLTNEDSQLLPYSNVLRTGKMETVHELSKKFDYIPPQPWSDPASIVAVIPVPSVKPNHYEGILVAGVSSRLRVNESYESFFKLLTTQLATAIANAGAFEEERKRTEALLQLDKAKTVFFNNISHEFRTPLTLMLNPLEELLNEQNNNLTGSEIKNIETSHRNGLRLLKLVNTLLDFSRIEFGRQQASFTLVDIADFTRNLASNFRSVVEKAGLSLIIKADAIIQPVYVDKQMWEKIVFNLLSNAFKYTLKGSITVELKSETDFVVLNITDTGVGIPEKELPHMFERFHRIENINGRTYEGTGIGLSLIKEMIKIHEGQISVESKLNEGSTFTVKIPFGKEHLPSHQIESAEKYFEEISSNIYVEEAETLIERNERKDEPVHDSTLPLVLVVDDNADMREHIQSVLSKRFNIITANNGMDALHKIQLQAPALILSDIMMPIVDGIRLLKEVKTNVDTAHIPVILLTARAGEESKIEGWETGADDYLVKPFSSKELVSRIASQIQTQKIRNEAIQKTEENEQTYRSVLETAGISLWESDFTNVKSALDELKQQGVTDFRKYFTANAGFIEKAISLVKVLDVNDATARMFEAIHKTELTNFLAQVFIAEILVAIAEGRTSIEEKLVLKTIKGNTIHVLLIVKLQPSFKKGGLVRFIVLNHS